MRRSRQLTGLRVIRNGDAKPLGRVCTTIFCPGESRVLGFTVYCGSWLKSVKGLLSEDVEHIGDDCVLVKDGRDLVAIESSDRLRAALQKKSSAAGMEVSDMNGKKIGFFDDVMVDEENLTVRGYVVTDGIIDDIRNGKTVIAHGDGVEFKDGAMLVDKNVCLVMRNDISLKRVFERDRE